MEALRFHKTVDDGGKIVLSKLPPGKPVDVIILLNEEDDFKADMRALMDKVQSRQMFKGLSKKEILQKLRKDREIVWEERHAD